MSRGRPTKATLTDDAGVLRCQFNPETLHRTKTATYRDVTAQGAHSQPAQQFVGTGPETLSVTLLFDALDPTQRTGAPLDRTIERVFGWLRVPTAQQSSPDPRPTVISFLWGTGLRFDGATQSVSVDYLMFDDSGNTLRANIALTLQSAPDPVAGQNPTSGGLGGGSTVRLGEADTLASLAVAHYGDPAMWRAIAITNQLRDPTRLPVGSAVHLLPPAQARSLLESGAGDG